MKITIEQMGKQARDASQQFARLSSERKNAILLAIAEGLQTASKEILEANASDIAAGKDAGLTAALLDRLTLNPDRIEGIISELRGVAGLPDPVGEIFEAQTLPNGLRVHKQRVPLGVLAVIYEARPNVTIDVAGLALKTGNAVILRGGSETLNSNRALVAVIRRALQACELPADIVQFIDDPDRALVGELLQMHEYVDMLIPRGGASLHKFCRENSRIPVITGGIGICHLFVDSSADLEAAVDVIHNAKVQRPSVCNALDTVLVHQDIAAAFLPVMAERLRQSSVSLRVDPDALSFFSGQYPGRESLPADIVPAGPQDFDTEWLSLILGVKVVAGLEEAIAHIDAHSTAHSDGILTRDEAHAQRFVSEVDSAAVYVNASTRFTDGGQLGLGAEVAISTQRLHARGPMGLRELTTYKWVIQGENHIRP